MPLTTNDALLEAWAEQIETMEQNLESLYGPPGITPTLPAITTEDGMLESIADIAGESAWGVANLYNALTTEHGTTYTVTVPSTSFYCAELVKIGGNTVDVNGELVNAEVTSVISKDGNVIDTVAIPEEVQALPGYGWSAGTAYNYIDYANKKFVQKVDRIDMGDMTWSTSASHFFTASISTVVQPSASKDDLGNIKCAKYETVSFNTLSGYTIDDCCSLGRSSGEQVNVQIYDTSYTSLAEFKAGVMGKYLYYELKTPVETDISAYLTDDIIKVVPGGTLTFENAEKLDVPSEVKHIGV